MTISLETPDADALPEIVRAVGAWQHEGASVQLHPGDLGWSWLRGATALASLVRTWRVDDELVAVGMLDGPDLLRVAIAREAEDDPALASAMVADVTDAARGVLPAGDVAIEARAATALQAGLRAAGWQEDEPWTPLRHDLRAPIAVPRGIERIDVDRLSDLALVHRSAFSSESVTAERCAAMATGTPFRDATCLVAYDDGVPAACAIVWSAGEGRPGVLEPMGVHAEHRGKGLGTAISIAAAAALRDAGASSATVCTETARVAAVATYRAAGYVAEPDARDLRRVA